MANYTEHPIIRQALELLACEIQHTDTLQSPDAVKDYLRLKLGEQPHEVFAVVFTDSQNRVIAYEELFRWTLNQTSVYPREVVLEALKRNAAAVILCHNHPSGAELCRGGFDLNVCINCEVDSRTCRIPNRECVLASKGYTEHGQGILSKFCPTKHTG